jgi:phage-related protein
MKGEKELRWVGSSYDDLMDFPREVRRTAGLALGKVQAGLDPDDWKPFDRIARKARK